MTTYKTATQWQQLFERRKTFDGTNIEFCQHHNVAITTYYKKRGLLQAQNQLSSKFVQVKQTTEITAQSDHATLLFDTHSGQLTLPASLPTHDIVAIIKGLMI